jgi:hypothetical protein
VRDHARFTAPRFVPPAGDDTPPGDYALQLVSWLRERLIADGLDIGEPVVEDWGCLLGVNQPGARLAVGIGPVSGTQGEFLVFVEPIGPGLVASLLRRAKPSDPAVAIMVAASVDRALHADPRITEITWFETNRRTGAETDHAAHPG